MSAHKPNILFIMADDLGWGDVSYHGSPIRTPSIDRLVEAGVELDRHYVQPMCTPTRAALLTGRYPSRFGPHATVPSNHPVMSDGYETLATTLRSGGYETGLFGKWHLGSSPPYIPNAYGFDWSYGSLAGGVDPYNHRYKRGPYSRTWHRNGEPVDERGHVTDLIVDEAVDWIESRTNPWFCYVPFTAVHVPVKAPQEWLDRYSDGQYDPDAARDRSYREYAAYASHMDHAVGRLIESLRRTDQVANTLVIFTSDNGALDRNTIEQAQQYPGYQEAEPRLGSNLPLPGKKAQLYEGGIRTPSLMSWPGTLDAGRVAAPMHISDWMPTLTRLVGCEPADDPQWDGLDAGAMLGFSSGSGQEDRTIYWCFRANEMAVLSGGLKLIAREQESGDFEDEELYDIDADPYETADLAPTRPEAVRELLGLMRAERRNDGGAARPDAADAQPV